MGCRKTTRLECSCAQPPSPRKSIAWIAPPCVIRTTSDGSPGAVVRSGNDCRRIRPRRLGKDLAERTPSGLGDERRDRNRPQPVDRAVEEDDEQEHPEPEERPASVTPRLGTASRSTCRMSVYENVNVPTSTPRTALNAQSR